MKEDPSAEFDMFEDVRRRLTQVLVNQGHDEIKAERVALYVMQGVRDVPKIIAALKEGRPDDVILSLLDKIFDNATALAKARSVLSGLGDKPVH